MIVLGVGGYSHDSAAAIVCNGRVVAAVAEERLTRKKHQGGVPLRAAQYCLDAAGVTLDDVDVVTAYMNPLDRLASRLPYRALRIPRSPAYSTAYMGYECVHNAQYALGHRQLLGRSATLEFVEHHPAHAASAFLLSPYDDAALLTIDYIGEWTSTWMGRGRGNTVDALREIAFPHSLGVFYSGITDYLGFQRASDEYKVMGLAPYGEPEFADAFRAMLGQNGHGAYRFDLSWMNYPVRPGPRCGYFSPKFAKRFGPPRKKDEPIEQRHMNIAASAQRALEETVLSLARWLHEQTGSRNLCMAGGVALNCAMNGRLLREGPFDNIFVQPAAGDDGIAIGGALQAYHARTGADRRGVLTDARLGPEFSSGEMEAALRDSGLEYAWHEDIASAAAKRVAGGDIVGWFQGRMEFGPRALGARSILADPTRDDMKDRVNEVVKHRESFRPFAPSCLAERAHEYFEGCGDSPFMLFVYPVRAAHRASLPAITHVDGTARVQTVSRETMPRYHALIAAFERERGVPVVLNTSFNVMGEPIVNTPGDAVRCMLGTGIDALAMGNWLAVKPDTP